MGKLTEKQIAEIVKKYKTGAATHRVLAEEYGVSRSTINRILNPAYAANEREANRERINRNRSLYEDKIKKYRLTLHTSNDADIIEKLEAVDNRQGYIKQLIRSDIEQSK